LREFIEGANWEYPDSAPSCFLEPDSGSKVGLSRIVANTFSDRGPTLLWVTEYGVWPSAEHMDLFDRYRNKLGLADQKAYLCVVEAQTTLESPRGRRGAQASVAEDP